MMAIGAETLPYVAAGCLGAALLFLVSGERERSSGRRVRALICGCLRACLHRHHPAVRLVRCGMRCLFRGHNSASRLSVVAALHLPLHSRSASASIQRRFAALSVIAVCAGGLLLTLFPQCLADPYAGLDPRLKTYWLDGVSEAQLGVQYSDQRPGDGGVLLRDTIACCWHCWF